MEIGDFSLALLLDCYRTAELSETDSETDSDRILPSSRAFSLHDSGSLERMRKVWTIGRHISQGLYFLHTNKLVHRGLKPGNGMFTI